MTYQRGDGVFVPGTKGKWWQGIVWEAHDDFVYVLIMREGVGPEVYVFRDSQLRPRSTHDQMTIWNAPRPQHGDLE